MKPVFHNTPNTLYRIDGKEVWHSRSAAVVGIVFAVLKEYEQVYVLVEKRSPNMPDEPNTWVVPSGYLDWDENGWHCLRRELYEETSFLIDHYEKYLMYDNEKEPLFTITTPIEPKQNVILNYCLIFDFIELGLPYEVEDYKCHEVTKVKWIPLNDISQYRWGFSHDERIKQAIIKCNDRL